MLQHFLQLFSQFSRWASGRSPAIFVTQPNMLSATVGDAAPLYRPGDKLGLILAYVSLIPAFIIFHRGSVLFHERSWSQLQLFLGTGSNAVISKVLKEMVRIERPQATCEALGLCGELGWPSTHSQIAAFAMTTMLLRRKSLAPLSAGRNPADTIELILLCMLTFSVPWSRVYLGYHDTQQVCAGMVFGTASAIGWYGLCEHGVVRKVLTTFAAPFQPLISHWKLA